MTHAKDMPKKRKFVKTPKKTKLKFFKSKKAKASDPITGEALKGVVHGNAKNFKKKSKTQKTPSGLFAGHLSNKTRKKVLVEAVKVNQNIKTIEEIDIRLKKYVEVALKRM